MINLIQSLSHSKIFDKSLNSKSISLLLVNLNRHNDKEFNSRDLASTRIKLV